MSERVYSKKKSSKPKLYTVLCNVFFIRNYKIQEKPHKKSMLLWIILNKQMSISRKIYKFWVYLSIQIGKYFRQGSECTVICAFFEPQSSHFQKLLRRSELLMKKGRRVRLKLSLTEKQIEQLDLESAQILTQLINLLMQQKGLLWT